MSVDFTDGNLPVNCCVYRKSMPCDITGENSGALGKNGH